MGEAADGACTNSADAAAWAKHKSSFESDMATCGKKCLGASSCVDSCIAAADGYSKSCSACFGDLAGCTKDHCFLDCIKGASAACTACVKKNGCDTGFVKCSGVTPPSAQVIADTSVYCMNDPTKHAPYYCHVPPLP